MSYIEIMRTLSIICKWPPNFFSMYQPLSPNELSRFPSSLKYVLYWLYWHHRSLVPRNQALFVGSRAWKLTRHERAMLRDNGTIHGHSAKIRAWYVSCLTPSTFLPAWVATATWTVHIIELMYDQLYSKKSATLSNRKTLPALTVFFRRRSTRSRGR